jgi:anti-sigma factor RsiW
MQSFLDGEASARDAERVREHTSECARCRSELEAWSTLFSGLGDLAQVAPAADFRERVLGALPPPQPKLSWAGRLAQGVARALGVIVPEQQSWLHGGHPSGEELQDFLEGLLSQPATLTLEGHLHSCRHCRTEVKAWRGMVVGIAALPSFAPSAEFPEKVMAHVRVQLALATAQPSTREQVQRLWSTISPRTRKRFAALAGASLTPAVTFGLLLFSVFSHPLATFSNLSSFLWLEGSSRLNSASAGMFASAAQSSTLGPVIQGLQLLLSSPGTAALAVSGAAGVTATAAWVLYRNVLATNPSERPRVR